MPLTTSEITGRVVLPDNSAFTDGVFVEMIGAGGGDGGNGGTAGGAVVEGQATASSILGKVASCTRWH